MALFAQWVYKVSSPFQRNSSSDDVIENGSLQFPLDVYLLSLTVTHSLATSLFVKRYNRMKWRVTNTDGKVVEREKERERSEAGSFYQKERAVKTRPLRDNRGKVV